MRPKIFTCRLYSEFIYLDAYKYEPLHSFAISDSLFQVGENYIALIRFYDQYGKDIYFKRYTFPSTSYH